MFENFLAHIERPNGGTGSRGVWSGFATFFGIALCLDLIQLFRGKGDFPEITILAGMLSMSFFFLSGRRLIRLASYGIWIAFLILYVVLRVQNLLR